MVASPVLYQNATRDVILIDIPTSIAVAQGRSDRLLSTEPLERPIKLDGAHSQNIKGAKAHKTQEFFHVELHAEYRVLIEQALAEICTHVSGSWCAPRLLMSQSRSPMEAPAIKMGAAEKELESRMKEWSACAQSKGDDVAFDLQQMMASLGATTDYSATVRPAGSYNWTMSYCPAHESTPGTQATDPAAQESQTEPWNSTLHNPSTLLLELTVTENAPQPNQLVQRYRFTVPPRSTLFLSDTGHPDVFRAAFREITDQFALPRHFDLVLLDPPWPNRSAKRKGAYEQTGGMPYLKRMLLKLDIDNYLEHNALVGIWITNKSSLREHVLGPGGLFETWNVGLIEEWVWIKTTTAGEAMFDIEHSMRKPYEILLLGRAAPNSWTRMTHATTIKRRVIAAVPDVHSRKPCLKSMLEQYLVDPDDYTALEIFSRYLVSGWTSWGNEVLKFNWEKYWMT